MICDMCSEEIHGRYHPYFKEEDDISGQMTGAVCQVCWLMHPICLGREIAVSYQNSDYFDATIIGFGSFSKKYGKRKLRVRTHIDPKAIFVYDYHVRQETLNQIREYIRLGIEALKKERKE